jgi:PIN domain nuclease of toxin-antitoxin system
MSRGCLLDTCALIWLASDHGALSPAARRVLEDADAALHFSAISALELERLKAVGRMTMRLDADAWLATLAERYRLVEIPVDAAIAAAAVRLPPIHKDPCDRIILATARLRRLAVVTADRIIPTYPDVRVIW